MSATTPSYPSHLLLLSFSSSSFPASVVLSPLIHTLSSPSLCIFFTLLTNLLSCLSVPCRASPHLTSPFPPSLAISLFISLSLTPHQHQHFLLIKSWGEGNTSCQTLCTSVCPNKTIYAFTAENNWSKNIQRCQNKVQLPQKQKIFLLGKAFIEGFIEKPTMQHYGDYILEYSSISK